MRASGVLLPVSSLSSKYGIGCFSKEAYQFVDFLKKNGQSYWQILPLGQTSYGDSPYQSFSTFAGNPYFISLEELIRKGLLKKKDCDAADFGKDPADVDYINAHGTSTHLNDLFETRAIKLAMGEAAYQCKISSTKSMVGHLLGAAGGVESIACVKSIMDGFVHVNAGLTDPDPECDLDCVKGEGIEMDVKMALSNSLGFGGHNATLIFKAFEE